MLLIDRYCFEQWSWYAVNKKVIFPIAKKKVIAVTKISDDPYAEDLSINGNHSILNIISNNSPSDLYLWTLTPDDYIVALNRYTNELLNINDLEVFCFICY